MIFTWDWKDTCVVFRWWHVRTQFDFLLSFIGIVAITALYELFKQVVFKWKRLPAQNMSLTDPLARGIERDHKIKGSVLYGLQVGYSFLLMLVFMTYNGWYMLAVVLGAIIGHYLWPSPETSTSMSMACH
ncbi:Piso0_001705 [Millerozyma farinosa CBS 7064]|uniref:Copper transport protein n=1 Tax=Pichia sorbitophila (strain ATCC MYA-4447 / BCRC 22081 / CBS 7064 / NBRC 10061 / NRRL Y-12695) TaxID=559304 RepID=G8YLI1_PICSO|nr:Piso0_001705 [Millerozyma farinosa CBS 7064]